MAVSFYPQIVSELARKRGFHLAGVAPIAADATPELSRFAEWIDAGCAGEMEYLKRRNENGVYLRFSADVPFPWARSVVVCAVNYNADQPYSIDPQPESDRVWIARYAWSGREQTPSPEPDVASREEKLVASEPTTQRAATDYHVVIRERLEQLRADLQQKVGDFQARCFVDTGPLVERIYAKYAGLGWQGKNTCLINESLGSWLFLGVILTSLELPRGQWAQPMPDRCGSCTRCIDACPTDALEPYRLNAARCIAYLTIEKRGAIPEEFAASIGRNVFGCDICQEVCPWNNRMIPGQAQRRPPITDWPELQPRTELVNPALDWLEAIGESEYRRMFRGSSLERAKFAGLRRNLENARKNQDGTPS
jgi:epoxyqueuosine reductase